MKNESDIILRQIEEIETEIKIKENSEEHKSAIAKLKSGLEKNKKLIEEKEDLLWMFQSVAFLAQK